MWQIFIFKNKLHTTHTLKPIIVHFYISYIHIHYTQTQSIHTTIKQKEAHHYSLFLHLFDQRNYIIYTQSHTHNCIICHFPPTKQIQVCAFWILIFTNLYTSSLCFQVHIFTIKLDFIHFLEQSHFLDYVFNLQFIPFFLFEKIIVYIGRQMSLFIKSKKHFVIYFF